MASAKVSILENVALGALGQFHAYMMSRLTGRSTQNLGSLTCRTPGGRSYEQPKTCSTRLGRSRVTSLTWTSTRRPSQEKSTESCWGCVGVGFHLDRSNFSLFSRCVGAELSPPRTWTSPQVQVVGSLESNPGEGQRGFVNSKVQHVPDAEDRVATCNLELADR